MIWPCVHVQDKYKLHLAETGKRKEYIDRVVDKETTWQLVKMYEIGIEQVIQILLCLWLMRYQMDELKDWRWADFMTQSTIGFLNFITFDYVPAEYLQKSMGKILLSMLSLSFSAAWMKTGNTGMSTGEKLLKILPLTANHLSEYSLNILLFGSKSIQ